MGRGEALGREEAGCAAVDEDLAGILVVADHGLLAFADPDLDAEPRRLRFRGVEGGDDLQGVAPKGPLQRAVTDGHVLHRDMLAAQFLELFDRRLDQPDRAVDLAQRVVARDRHRAAEVAGGIEAP